MFYFYHQISFFYFRNQISSSQSLTKEAMPVSQINLLLKYSFILSVFIVWPWIWGRDRSHVAIVVALVWPFPVWVCDADSWDRDRSVMDFSCVWRLEQQRDWVCDGSLSFLFFFPLFSLVALLRLVSFAGFCFCFLFFTFFFRVTWPQGSWLGWPARIGGPSHFAKGGPKGAQVFFFENFTY